MDSELLYLTKRANFHSRMARQAGCDEARCAHQAFVRAYMDRIERWTRRPGAGRAEQDGGFLVSAGRAASMAARPELVR